MLSDVIEIIRLDGILIIAEGGLGLCEEAGRINVTSGGRRIFQREIRKHRHGTHDCPLDIRETFRIANLLLDERITGSAGAAEDGADDEDTVSILAVAGECAVPVSTVNHLVQDYGSDIRVALEAYGEAICKILL